MTITARDDNIKLIENAPYPLDTRRRLLLTYIDEEPVQTEHFNRDIRTHYGPWAGEMIPTQDIAKSTEEFSALLRQLRLPFQYRHEYSWPDEGEGNKVDRFYFANNEDLLKRFFDAFQRGDHAEMGRCYRIPETAIEAFLGKRPKKSFKIVHEKAPRMALHFSQFAFSREFWKEELEVGIKRAARVEALSPELYQETLAMQYKTHPLHEDVLRRNRKLYLGAAPSLLTQLEMEESLMSGIEKIMGNSRRRIRVDGK